MRAEPKSLVVVFALALAGCAAPVTRPSSVALLITGSPTIQARADWRAFCNLWRPPFSTAAAAVGMRVTYLNLEAESLEQPLGTVLARVFVNDYRYITGGTRYGFGVMTTNGFIDADVEFFELPSRRSIGTRRYATPSTASQGLFYDETDKQVREISREMIQEVIRR